MKELMSLVTYGNIMLSFINRLSLPSHPPEHAAKSHVHCIVLHHLLYMTSNILTTNWDLE